MDDAHETIWTYLNHHEDRTNLRPLIRSEKCVFCSNTMHVLKAAGGISGFCGDSVNSSFRIRCCPICGWWNLHKTEVTIFFGENTDDEWGNAGVLKKFDISDQTLPVEAIRSYLAARYSDRFNVDPYKFEDVVASVYRDLGFQVRVTGRSGDEGVDVILDGPLNVTIGVQVKRYRGKIKVEHIHSLAGALIRKRLPAGIFVTTSSYQPGAVRAADDLAIAVAIELVDAAKFYDALGIGQRAAYAKMPDPTAPFVSAPLIDVNRPAKPDEGPYYVL